MNPTKTQWTCPNDFAKNQNSNGISSRGGNGITIYHGKNMIPVRHTSIEMGWPQPQTPIQTDNSTAVEFTNKTIVNKAKKSADMKLWWIRDR